MPSEVRKTHDRAGISILPSSPSKMSWEKANCWSPKLSGELRALTGTRQSRGDEPEARTNHSEGRGAGSGYREINRGGEGLLTQ